VRASYILTTSVLLCGGLTTSGCSDEGASKDHVLLFAAASSAGPMRELVDEWNEQHDVQLQTSYASSSTLA